MKIFISIVWMHCLLWRPLWCPRCLSSSAPRPLDSAAVTAPSLPSCTHKTWPQGLNHPTIALQCFSQYCCIHFSIQTGPWINESLPHFACKQAVAWVNKSAITAATADRVTLTLRAPSPQNNQPPNMQAACRAGIQEKAKWPPIFASDLPWAAGWTFGPLCIWLLLSNISDPSCVFLYNRYWLVNAESWKIASDISFFFCESEMEKNLKIG